MNLRTRFAILTSALVLVVTMAMSLGAYTIASYQLERQVDTSLNQRATRILAIVADPRFSWNDAFGRGPVNQAILQTEVDAITQVMLPDGQVIKRREYPRSPWAMLTGLWRWASRRSTARARSSTASASARSLCG